MANCSSGLLGVIVRKTFYFIPVVPLLARKMKTDLSEIKSPVGLEKPSKKGMGVFGRKNIVTPMHTIATSCRKRSCTSTLTREELRVVTLLLEDIAYK